MEKILFYSYPSCTSCRKTKKWLNSHLAAYTERHIFRDGPTVEELKKILSMTTEGLDEILATRSATYKNLDVDLNELPLSEVLKILVEEPRLLRRPILTDGEQLIIGHHEEALSSLVHTKGEHRRVCMM